MSDTEKRIVKLERMIQVEQACFAVLRESVKRDVAPPSNVSRPSRVMTPAKFAKLILPALTLDERWRLVAELKHHVAWDIVIEFYFATRQWTITPIK
jgi:hypothetical protein